MREFWALKLRCHGWLSCQIIPLSPIAIWVCNICLPAHLYIRCHTQSSSMNHHTSGCYHQSTICCTPCHVPCHTLCMSYHRNNMKTEVLRTDILQVSRRVWKHFNGSHSRLNVMVLCPYHYFFTKSVFEKKVLYWTLIDPGQFMSSISIISITHVFNLSYESDTAMIVSLSKLKFRCEHIIPTN